MKKKHSLVIIMLLVFLTGCTSSVVKNLSYKDFLSKVDKKETLILEVVQDGCSYCESFAPKFEKVLKENNLTAFKLNLSKLSDKEETEFKLKYLISGTPNVVFINEGNDTSLMHRIDGDVSEERIKEKLELNGYIK